MSYVPGFINDIFITYALADDQVWVETFRDRLRDELTRALGTPPVVIWRDENNLRRGQQYQPEIAQNVSESAILVALASPSFVASSYCEVEERARFLSIVNQSHSRFRTATLRNDSFTLELSILPPPGGGEHNIFPGTIPIHFHEGGLLMPAGTNGYEAAFQKVLADLRPTLFLMRSSCRPVFLYPYRPEPGITGLAERLRTELHKHFYRVLPANIAAINAELDSSEFSSHLVSEKWDQDLENLINRARTTGKPWISCTTTLFRNRADVFQKDLLKRLEAEGKLLIVTEASVWNEVRDALLGDCGQRDKKRVALIVDEVTDSKYADAIKNTYLGTFDFFSPDPTQRFVRSDGLLAIAGDTGRVSEIAKRLIQTKDAGRKGFVALGASEVKSEITAGLREFGGIEVIEQYGSFHPDALNPFFSSIHASET